MMKILIIEDEPFARSELVRLLKATGRDFEILGELDTVEDSVKWLKTHRLPDLIFLDIQLADGISFEIFRQVEVNTPIIFTTAYDEYAISAFQLNSIDYLLKPIRQEALEKALRKLDTLRQGAGKAESGIRPEQLESILSQLQGPYKSRILVRLGDQLKSVDVSEVAYFYAEDDIVFLYLKGRSRYIVDRSLNDLEGILDPKAFFRITRNCIATIGSIKKVSKYFNSRLLVELDPPAPDKLLVSRVRVPDLLLWMDQ